MSEQPTHQLMKIRGRIVGDTEFIASTWLNYVKQYTGIGKSVSKSVFMDNHGELVKKALKVSNIIVACHKDDPETILGFAVTERASHQDVVHFVFVRKELRGKGVGQSLLNVFKKKNRVCITHSTRKENELFTKNYSFVEYNPYRFLNGENFAI